MQPHIKDATNKQAHPKVWQRSHQYYYCGGGRGSEKEWPDIYKGGANVSNVLDMLTGTH